MPRATKDVQKALLKKGFTLEKKRDHAYYFVYIGNKKTRINTKISHGSHKDISDSLLKLMMKEMKLQKKEFDEYMNCTLTKDEYLTFLKENKYI
ncbi:MAG: hypothetical protein IJV15_00180 [Lachnospiraceae bacterium]|nr:hypothetical protein [Lachnospiraceae bacterium]